MPGPEHLLEPNDQMPLTQEQTTKIKALFDAMKMAAIPAGERLFAAETALEAAFKAGSVDDASLQRVVAASESARSVLRFFHLSQHYKTVPLLQPEQIKRYNLLRSCAEYPCANVPQGHDPAMYRRHMGGN